MEQKLTFRLAVEADLLGLVNLLSDDPLGALREKAQNPLPECYLSAFDTISKDTSQELTVAELDGELVGTFQLTFIQYLTHQGGLRAQIEAVRVKSRYRGHSIGTKMIAWAIERAEEKGCYLVQLTTDKQRSGAIQFYETLGFNATHEGMKLKL